MVIKDDSIETKLTILLSFFILLLIMNRPVPVLMGLEWIIMPNFVTRAIILRQTKSLASSL